MKQLSSVKRSFRSMLLGVFALTALGTGSVQGASLDLSLLDFPDIVSSDITVEYNATSNTLTAVGFATQLKLDGSLETIYGDHDAGTGIGSFSLTASIDENGDLSGGSLTILGETASYQSTGTLLTGTLTDFGFPDSGADPLEFLFNVTGGDIQTLYNGLPGGIILSATDFPGDFDSNWFNDDDGVADVAPVPLPAAAWLFGSALLGLVGFARRRQKSTSEHRLAETACQVS